MDPVIDRWYFTDLPSPRGETGRGLLASGRPKTPLGPMVPVYAMPSPQQAWMQRSRRQTPLIELWSWIVLHRGWRAGTRHTLTQAQHLQN